MSPAPPSRPRRCVEEQCDRNAADHDARCALHAQRLGPLALAAVIEPDTEPPAANEPVDATVPERPAEHFYVMLGATCAAILALYFGFFALGSTSAYLHPIQFYGSMLLAAFSFFAGPVAGGVSITWSRGVGQKIGAWFVFVVAMLPALLVAVGILGSLRC